MVRQTEVMGDKLVLHREITALIDRPEIIIKDTVENIGFEKSPVLILYHINIGYPILDTNSKIIEGKSKVRPLSESAKKGFDSFFTFSDPVPDFDPQVFFHEIQEDKDRYAKIAFVNPEFNKGRGLGVCLSYNKETLPYCMQWKQLRFGEYVCGFEPSNSINNREISQKNKTLKFIEPGQKINYKIKMSVLDSNEKIKALNFTN